MAEEEKQNNIPEASSEDELSLCKKQCGEYLAGWQRAKADFLNYKKEELNRLQDIARYGNEEMIMDLIGVLDSFDLGITTLEKAGPVEKGVYMIRAQLEDILKKRGLEKVTLKIGEPFNPLIAEVISEVESDQAAGNVVEEIETGYKLYDKIIRPARVKVAKLKSS